MLFMALRRTMAFTLYLHPGCSVLRDAGFNIMVSIWIHRFAERYVKLTWAKSWALSWAQCILRNLAETTFVAKDEDCAQDVNLDTLASKLDTLDWTLSR